MELRKLLAETAEAFDRLGIDYALIGGYAGILYGSPYTTADIDFVVVSEKVTLSLVKELAKLGWVPTEKYETVEELRAFGQFVHKEKGWPLHLLPDAAGYALKGSLKMAEIKVEGYPIKICSPEDLIIMRLAVGTDEDKIKAAAIALANRLDLEYLKKRAKEEKIEKKLGWLMKEIRKV
jgi:hypothetical protein